MDTLTRFNQQILESQDDAYTLAWYLLGNQVEAEAVMQKAVEAAYHCVSELQVSCRLLILKQIANLCQERKPVAHNSTTLNIPFNFDSLQQSEQLVLVLVDILGMNYIDAALVTNRPVQEVSRLLALARRKLMNQKEYVTS